MSDSKTTAFTPPALRVDVPGHPHVYYSLDADNFYQKDTLRGMGWTFYSLHIETVRRMLKDADRG